MQIETDRLSNAGAPADLPAAGHKVDADLSVAEQEALLGWLNDVEDDGRGNGNDPNLPAFEEITRRARETIWLTPEPRYSWGLGGCDLPAYAEYCSRVRVVRDLTGLESAATDLATELVGR